MEISGNANTITRKVYEYNPFPQPTTSVSPKGKLSEQWGQLKAYK